MSSTFFLAGRDAEFEDGYEWRDIVEEEFPYHQFKSIQTKQKSIYSVGEEHYTDYQIIESCFRKIDLCDGVLVYADEAGIFWRTPQIQLYAYQNNKPVVLYTASSEVEVSGFMAAHADEIENNLDNAISKLERLCCSGY